MSNSTSSSNNHADVDNITAYSDYTSAPTAPTADNQPAVTLFLLDCMIEICGLNALSNGCTCTSHETCGFYALKEFIAIVDNKPKPIKLVKLSEGCKTCTIGLIPQV
jgi:hypothetical protein